MTVKTIIDELLEREGENGPNFLDRADAGGRTTWGVSERAHPEMWWNGPPTKAEAALLYEREYLAPFFYVRDEALRVQLFDIAVNSGRSRANKLLQQALGVKVDGVAGPKTRMALDDAVHPHARHLNNALVAFRLKFIRDISVGTQKRFKAGWENRALSFLLFL